MRSFGRSLGCLTLAGLALGIAGCGSQPDPSTTRVTVEDAQSPDAAEVAEGGPSAGAITAADAARGDGAALPADDNGPTAYDLTRARGDRPESRQPSPSGDATRREPDAGEGADPSRAAENVADAAAAPVDISRP